MKKLQITHPLHKFAKTNFVTQWDKIGLYDEWICENCGIKGKKYSLANTLFFPENTPDSLLKNCSGSSEFKDNYVGKSVVISTFTGEGSAFANITPDSVHQIVIPPQGYFNGDNGVWVMGIGEPVKILNREIKCFLESEEKPKMVRTKFNKKRGNETD